MEQERENDECSEYTEEEIEEVDDDSLVFVEAESNGLDLQQFVSNVIGKVRKVVTLFRRSPLQNEILQRHIQRQFNAELKLILDSKTRWNSLLEMIEKFVTVEKCIRMALVEVGSSVTVTDREI